MFLDSVAPVVTEVRHGIFKGGSIGSECEKVSTAPTRHYTPGNCFPWWFMIITSKILLLSRRIFDFSGIFRKILDLVVRLLGNSHYQTRIFRKIGKFSLPNRGFFRKMPGKSKIRCRNNKIFDFMIINHNEKQFPGGSAGLVRCWLFLHSVPIRPM